MRMLNPLKLLSAQKNGTAKAIEGGASASVFNKRRFAAGLIDEGQCFE